MAEPGSFVGLPEDADQTERLKAELSACRAELERTAWERDVARAQVTAVEAVACRMADSLPAFAPLESWSERDLAVRDYEGELATALAVEVDPQEGDNRGC